ncbi:MAG: hypothetical protein LBT84_06575, partial [Spirochaetia bacterium]|nr:hypothetical protein [Spirochaetia bacterium]
MKRIISLSLSFLFLAAAAGAAEISPDGSLNHSIEIRLPKGTAELNPQLSLSYNSNAGSGIAGQGFSLEGLGAIERDASLAVKYDIHTGFTASLSVYITGIESHIGSRTSIEYALSTRMPGAIEPSASQYPKVSDPYAVPLVKNITLSDGRGGVYSTAYSYRNSRSFAGFPEETKSLYFESVTETNLNTGVSVITYYNQTNELLAGTPVMVETGSPAGPISKAIYTYEAIAT